MGGEELKFQENDTMHVKCVVIGGNPRPELLLTSNQVNVEERYEVRVDMGNEDITVVNDDLGQERYNYEITKEATAIPVTYEFVGHNFTCITYVPNIDQTLAKSFRITMDGGKSTRESSAITVVQK